MSWRICAGFDFDRRTDKADDGYDAARVAHEVANPASRTYRTTYVFMD